MQEENQWDIVIDSKPRFFDIRFYEIWKYRDLLFLLVKRDYKASFKQTILGPVWFFIQPILTTLLYVLVFANIAKLGTDGVPAILFYMSGVIVWNYFSTCLISTSSTFVSNANLFGKVYFPRIIIPVAVVVSNLYKFLIQFLFFFAVLLYFVLFRGNDAIHVGWEVLLLPFLLLIVGLLGMSFGLIVSALTTKYRDLVHLVGFGVQLLMYATPVVYPLSIITDERTRTLITLNPMTSVLETFRHSFLGSGSVSYSMLGYSFGISVVLFALAVVLFSRVEKTFMDTV